MYLIKKCDVYFAPLIDKRLWFSCSLYASRLLSVESTIRFRLESIKTIKVRYAAAWESDQNVNVAAARALMQSGLRSCPESEDMWIEYLRMELTYLNKLKARKVALGEDVKTLQKSSDDSGQWKEENKELFMSLDEQGDSPKESGLEDVAL